MIALPGTGIINHRRVERNMIERKGKGLNKRNNYIDKRLPLFPECLPKNDIQPTSISLNLSPGRERKADSFS